MTRLFKRGGKKILLVDIDGTLVDYEGNLPASAVCAVKTAQKNGHRVYMCTGRSEGEIYENIRSLELDGMIGGNGAYVRDGTDILLHQHLSEEQCGYIVNWCHARGLEFYLETNNGLFASERFEEAGNPVLREYSRRKGNDSPVSVHTVFPGMIFGGNLIRNDVNKISYILHSLQDYKDSLTEFPDLEAGTWGGAGETPLFGDLRVKDISKKTAVACLLAHLGVSAEDAVAFGDAAVDIPMFEACGYAVAMASGGEECRAAADYVTDAVEQDGLYKAFLHLGLIE